MDGDGEVPLALDAVDVAAATTGGITEVDGEPWVVLTAHREWLPRQIASLTKVVTCWVVLRIVAALEVICRVARLGEHCSRVHHPFHV